MDELALYTHWLECVRDEEVLGELRSLEGDREAIIDRFYRLLEFGTGGLRGVLGAGTNRMNLYTVGKASQGYANYLLRHFASPSVAISYDSRVHSRDFAERAAAVFAENGVAVAIYPRLMPTPALSFAVRHLRCSGGVMVTASHNPAEYNGYKVYGADGCQITAEAAGEIQREINGVDEFDDVRVGDLDTLLAEGRIRYIDEDTVERYMAAVDGCSLFGEKGGRDVPLVYTPLNGAGISCVPRCLAKHGFTRVFIPPEQGTPDGRFPTCPTPNPEIREALEVGLRTARETGSELVLATDPDCDRVGVAVREGEDYVLLNGNETGVLLFDFVCRMRREQGTMPERPIAIKTIVTTPMAASIAREYGVELIDVLTGFKYIGEQIGTLEARGEEERYIFGFEESYGYLSGSYVRDKDAVNASLLICEMFDWYRRRGQSLAEGLRGLYARHGHYATKLLSYTFPGAAGFAEMQRRMEALRRAPPATLGGLAVTGRIDYDQEGTGLPRSNVLRYTMFDAEAVVRPSGTEPKLKIYLTGHGRDKESSGAILAALAEHFDHWIC